MLCDAPFLFEFLCQLNRFFAEAGAIEGAEPALPLDNGRGTRDGRQVAGGHRRTPKPIGATGEALVLPRRGSNPTPWLAMRSRAPSPIELTRRHKMSPR
jgi:hypothetical protein